MLIMVRDYPFALVEVPGPYNWGQRGRWGLVRALSSRQGTVIPEIGMAPLNTR